MLPGRLLIKTLKERNYSTRVGFNNQKTLKLHDFCREMESPKSCLYPISKAFPEFKFWEKELKNYATYAGGWPGLGKRVAASLYPYCP